jgi:hypothetical protein
MTPSLLGRLSAEIRISWGLITIKQHSANYMKKRGRA